MELGIILGGVSLIFSATTAVFSFYAYAYMVGVQKSTHQVQLIPADQMGPTGKDLAKGFAGISDDQEQI